MSGYDPVQNALQLGPQGLGQRDQVGEAAGLLNGGGSLSTISGLLNQILALL